MSAPVLCILVDAFRHDYLTDSRAPNLTALAERQNHARMRPILGYSDSIRATIFTGAYPDEHGYWMEYCRRPAAAPMASLARLSALDHLPDFPARLVKFGLSQTLVRAIARRRGYAHLSTRNMPFRALASFDWTLRDPMTADGVLGAPTLFDRLTAAGVPWRYLDSTKLSRRGLLRAVDELPGDTALAFVYLHHIDMASHVLGIDASLFWRSVSKTDAHVGAIVERFGQRFPGHRLIVFSDHGMSRVDRIVSYRDLWTHPRFPHDFCFALDATMVRLWFDASDPALREDVRRRVSERAPGRFLTAEEIRDFRLDLSDRLYGDEIYLIEPRTAIFPNFHSMQRPKAMHAYDPDDLDQQGIFIADTADELPETVELVEVHRRCEDLTGLGATAAGAAA